MTLNTEAGSAIFISYAREDQGIAEKLYEDLCQVGLNPWLDVRSLLPGQNWQLTIQQAIQNSKYFVAILSRNSLTKRGYAQKELRMAMDVLDKVPSSEIFIIPVRIDDCEPVDRRLKEIHWADFSEAYESGLKQVLRVLLPDKLALIDGKITRYCKIMSEMEILPYSLWPEGIEAQPTHFRDIYFRQISGREAVRGRTSTFDQLKQNILHNKVILLIIGEAGIGKTTFCRWLCRESVFGGCREMSGPCTCVPVLIVLRELSCEDLEDIMSLRVAELNLSLQELASICGERQIKVLLLFDGLNEIEERKRELVVSRVYGFSKDTLCSVSIVFTSRSVGVTEKLCSLMGDRAFIYEVQRWNETQLRNYLGRNRIDTSLLDMLPTELRSSLQLPLFAWLFIQANRGVSEKPFSTMGDVFKAFIETWLRPKRYDSQRYQSVVGGYDLALQEKTTIIETLAFHMTQGNTVIAICRQIEALLSSNKKHTFKPLALDIINSGILRCVGKAALDYTISVVELRDIQIMFLHQAFQEYLTAEYVVHNPEARAELPGDISKDAFWRDVPIHVMRSIGTTSTERERALRFIDSFLGASNPDFWTAARLAKEINVLDQTRVSQKIAKMLVADMSRAITYPHNLEAFAELGDIGRQALLKILGDSERFATVLSIQEAHLYSGEDLKVLEEVEDLESLWRKFGRPVTILGELGDARLFDLTLSRLDRIRSLHITYHILEAYLLLIRRESLAAKFGERTITKLQELNWLTHNNPIVAAYAMALMKEVKPNSKIDGEILLAQGLVDFLRQRASLDNPYFEEEFWQRAHGLLVLPEAADVDETLKLMQELASIEEIASYGPGKHRGYISVHSAIVTSVVRLQNRSNIGFARMRSLLEELLQSDRLAENVWAYRWLENLLLMVCTRQETAWLQAWLVRDSLPEETKRLIRNVTRMLIT